MVRRVPDVLPTAIVSAGLGVLLAVGAVIFAGPWHDGQRVAEQEAAAAPSPAATKPVAKKLPQLSPGPEHEPAVAALLPVFAGDAALGHATPGGLAAVLNPLSTLSGLGKHVGLAVADPSSSTLLYDKSATDAFAPASTNKIVTTLAALAALGPDHRITTKVVEAAAPAGATSPAPTSTKAAGAVIVLVGGGDPTLTALPPAAGPAADPDYQPASLDDLAAQTAAALAKSGVKSVTLGYDTSLYAGPTLQYTWPVAYTDGNVSPVTALMADEGLGKGNNNLLPRVTDPAAMAAADFAAKLTAHGVTVVGRPISTTAAAGDAELASVQSPRLADLVEHTLTWSDNDLAEALLRQVAIADGKPVTFAGGVAAVRDVLSGKAVGLDLTGLNVVDGSGLSRQDRITPSFLVRALAAAAATNHPDLRAVLTGLPVADFTGTLDEDDRFAAPQSSNAAGLVRAKTGSLTGIDALAGLVRDSDGQLLVFAFMADQTSDAVAARAALDRLAAGITACGCR